MRVVIWLSPAILLVLTCTLFGIVEDAQVGKDVLGWITFAWIVSIVSFTAAVAKAIGMEMFMHDAKERTTYLNEDLNSAYDKIRQLQQTIKDADNRFYAVSEELYHARNALANIHDEAKDWKRDSDMV